MNSKQVAEMFDLTPHTIRYYEKVGVIPPIQRDDNGYRIYQKNDLNWIFLAKSLRNAGLPVKSLVKFAELSQVKSDVATEQKQILQEQLQEIDNKIKEMTETQKLLQYKIDTFDEHLAQFKSGEMTPDNVEELWKMNHI